MNTPDFNTNGMFNATHVNITLLSDADCKVLIDGKNFCTLSKNIPIQKVIDNINHVFTFTHMQSGIIMNYEFYCARTPAPNTIIKVQLMKEILAREKTIIQKKKDAKMKRKKWWEDNGAGVTSIFFLIMCLLFIVSLIFIVAGWFNGGHNPVWTVTFWVSLIFGAIPALVMILSDL